MASTYAPGLEVCAPTGQEVVVGVPLNAGGGRRGGEGRGRAVNAMQRSGVQEELYMCVGVHVCLHACVHVRMSACIHMSLHDHHSSPENCGPNGLLDVLAHPPEGDGRNTGTVPLWACLAQLAGQRGRGCT